VTGIVAQRSAQVGEHVAPGTPLLAIIPLDEIWVYANFKEVQLGKMKIGQPVKMKADIYGGNVPYHGKVVGIAGGTGSVFSVIPPQNATGNWIKIVQRLPVKISLDPEEIKRHPLRLGLSMDVTVDLHDTQGSSIPAPYSAAPVYETDVFAKQIEGVEEVIDEIVAYNVDDRFLLEDYYQAIFNGND
jgi:membrane fusion protein (multidrug efflux system)